MLAINLHFYPIPSVGRSSSSSRRTSSLRMAGLGCPIAGNSTSTLLTHVLTLSTVGIRHYEEKLKASGTKPSISPPEGRQLDLYTAGARRTPACRWHLLLLGIITKLGAALLARHYVMRCVMQDTPTKTVLHETVNCTLLRVR